MSKTTYKNLNAIPNWKLKELLDDPYTMGIDGSDYGPARNELEQIFWERMAQKAERDLAQSMKDFKAQFKHNSRAHKSA